ncbi:hypothetical protein ES703_52308 [subsurface metagenome]
MDTAEPSAEIKRLTRLNEYGPDDLFICCASFEERCLAGASKMERNYRTNFSTIFVIEEPLYKKQVDTNLNSLKSMLGTKSSKGIFVISCQRDGPVEGIAQLKGIWNQCGPRDLENPYITVDISGFTKIYLLQLLNYLIIDLKLGFPRLIHTTQTYLPTKLTKGVAQITTIPNFYGSILLEKQTVLVLFLGFEPERSLAVWKHFNPAKTIALITNPPRYDNLNYLKYAEKNNSYLLSQSSVELRNVPADNPYAAKKVLEAIYEEIRASSNMIIGPFGTKPQAVGVFLFCLEHPKIQVIYSLPVKYTRSYLWRKPGPTLLLPLNPVSV